MHTIWCGLVLLLIALPVVIISGQKRRGLSRKSTPPLPPGPKRWPVVGNIFQLAGFSANESLAKLSAKHGPTMTMWLGSMCTVVISSSVAAREMFKKNDVALAGRKIYEAMKGDFGNEGSLVTAQYGPTTIHFYVIK